MNSPIHPQPGDLLLMLNDAQISTLIAWCSDSIYSHVALMADNGELIEAATRGARAFPLAQRLSPGGSYRHVDAFTPLDRNRQPLQEAARASVVAHARSLIGTPYPTDTLATLGLVVAVRGKLPGHPLARLAVRIALDHLIARADDAHRMVCSELVYRCLAECAWSPAGTLAPDIVITPPGTTPFPHIDWARLAAELQAMKPRSDALQQVAGQVRDSSPLTSATADAGDDAELHALRRDALLALGGRTAPMLASGEEPVPGAWVNPKVVTPQDLAASPSSRHVARLMQRPETP